MLHLAQLSEQSYYFIESVTQPKQAVTLNIVSAFQGGTPWKT